MKKSPIDNRPHVLRYNLSMFKLEFIIIELKDNFVILFFIQSCCYLINNTSNSLPNSLHSVHTRKPPRVPRDVFVGF